MKIAEIIENRLAKWVAHYTKPIIYQILFGCIIYFTIMAENLYNDLDGIWHTSNFIAGDWEISLGRGLLRYFDKVRFGVLSVPFNVVLTILLLGITNLLLIRLFSVKSKIAAALFVGILIANPVVCCTLTYGFTTVNYASAFLFAVGGGLSSGAYRMEIRCGLWHLLNDFNGTLSGLYWRVCRHV